MKKSIKTGLALFAMLIVLGLAGNVERTEEIIYHMPQAVYDTIKAKVGDSEYRIAKEYVKNRELYERTYTDSTGH